MPPKKRSRTCKDAGKPPTSSSIVAKTGSGNKGARVVAKGKLNILPDMPLDVLYEIFSHLDPPSVLNVSYTSRGLRSILITKNSRAVWRDCLASDADLPRKPDSLNEPQWIELAFGNTCTYCKTQCRSILWTFSVRVCRECAQERFIYENDVERVLHKPYKECLLHLQIYGVVDYTRVYKLDSIEATIESFRSIDATDAGAVKKFEAPFLDRVRQAQKYAETCDHWLHVILPRKRRLEQERMMKERLHQIECRLREHGFSEEIDYLHAVSSRLLEEHPLVRSFDELTESTWRTLIPPLTKLLRDMRASMLEKKRKNFLKDRMQVVISALKAYVSAHPVPTAIDDVDQIYPSALDIAAMPAIQRMMFTEIKSYVTDVEPDLKRLKEALAPDALDTLCDEWRAAKSLKLVALLPDNYRHHQDEDDDELYSLRFACVFFHCTVCGEPVNYPRVLAHACTRQARLGFRNLSGEESWLWQRLDALPWNHDGARIEWDARVARAAWRVIKSCGCDPRIVDQGDMDEEAAWLACLTCEGKHKGKEREVFDWRRAIMHHLGHINKGEDDPTWLHLRDDEDIQLAIQAEARCRQRDDIEARQVRQVPRYVCVLCRRLCSLNDVDDHLKSGHNKFTPEEGVDYRLDVDASMRGLCLPITIPRRVVDLTKGSGGSQRKGKGRARRKEVISIDD